MWFHITSLKEYRKHSYSKLKHEKNHDNGKRTKEKKKKDNYTQPTHVHNMRDSQDILIYKECTIAECAIREG